MAEKRPSPEGNTPVQSKAARRLEGEEEGEARGLSRSIWTVEEIAALLEYIALHCPDKWPSTKNGALWNGVAEFVFKIGKGTLKCTGGFTFCIM